jgi:hypothetical protein
VYDYSVAGRGELIASFVLERFKPAGVRWPLHLFVMIAAIAAGVKGLEHVGRSLLVGLLSIYTLHTVGAHPRLMI